MTAPLRIQRSRAKGWRMPENTVYVGRPSRWGNPFRFWLGEGENEFGPEYEAQLFREWIESWHEQVWFLRLAGPRNPALANATVATLRERRAAIIADRGLLRGKNLACWCRLCAKHAAGKPFGEPCPDCWRCHTDILGAMANGIRLAPPLLTPKGES